MNQNLVELHYDLADVLERYVEPILKRRAKEPEGWRISLVCRNSKPGTEGQWVNVTNDDPAEVVKILTEKPGSVIEAAPGGREGTREGETTDG